MAGALRGAGDTKFVAKLTFFTVMLLRPGLALLAINVFSLGLPGAWFAILTDQIIVLLIAWRYQSGRWKESVLRTKAAA